MARVKWSRAALRGLASAIDYIRNDNPIAAQSIGIRLISLGESLSDFPNRGRPAGRFRELATVPPFILRYSVKGDTVTIRSIRHGRRRPLKT